MGCRLPPLHGLKPFWHKSFDTLLDGCKFLMASNYYKNLAGAQIWLKRYTFLAVYRTNYVLSCFLIFTREKMLYDERDYDI